ncbi:MAG: hypothetical protein R3D80_05350 [Paracoccaceae bacterium]
MDELLPMLPSLRRRLRRSRRAWARPPDGDGWSHSTLASAQHQPDPARRRHRAELAAIRCPGSRKRPRRPSIRSARYRLDAGRRRAAADARPRDAVEARDGDALVALLDPLPLSEAMRQLFTLDADDRDTLLELIPVELAARLIEEAPHAAATELVDHVARPRRRDTCSKKLTPRPGPT